MRHPLQIGGRKAWSASARYFWLLAIYPGAWGDVQQQNLITRTVTLTHAQDPSWPDGSDSEDSQVWTNNNQNVKINSIIDIEFAENIQESIGYITVQPPILLMGTSTASATTIPVPSVDVSVSGAKLTLTPPSCTPPCVRSDVFAEETVYTVSFDAGVIQNLAGTDSNAAFSVQFTTGDFTAPVLLTSSPADDTPNVAVTSSIVFTFSENIQVNAAASFIWQIQDKHGEQSPTTYSAPCNDAQVSVSGAVATITILASNFPLLPCQWYQVVYAAQCFTDTSTNLNYVAALPSTDYYDWWTSCITAYSPAIGTYGVPINSDIILTFSEAIVRGTGNIIFTPLGEASQSYDVTDTARVLIDSTQTQVTIVGDVSPNYLCLSLGSDMQKCKGKPVDITIAAGVFTRVDTTGLAAGDYDLKDQLTGSDYRFTLTPADLTPPIITVVSMYGITENVIRVTIRLSESGTTYCRAYDSGSFNPVSQGGTDVPTLTDCTSCAFEIKTSSGVNFVGSSTYDSSTSFAEHEVDVSGLTAKTFYWVYCYSHDDEIPTVNVATSSQMLATEQSVRTLDTTPPSFTRFSCVETPGTEDSITVTLSMNEAGRAYCKVVNKGFDPPTNNAVISEGFYFETSTMSEFNITVNKISTGLGATGMEALHRKWDYDVYCWGQDAEGYPYYGPNGMASPEACPSNPVTTLDLTRPSLRFIMAESISSSQIIITLQVNEGARVWCAAWTTDPGFTDTASAVSGIKGQSSNCMDNKGRQCGTFWIYDLDDLEDTAADGVTTLNEYYSTSEWRFNQDFDIIVSGLMEQTNYPYIYCYAEDDETDGIGSSPNTMIFDASGNAGPDNIHTIWAGTGTVQTLDESPPEFTTLTVKDPSDQNDRLVVTFALNEAGTAYCRVTRSDSGETDLRINRILSADYYATVSAASILGTITIDKLESSDTKSLYEASQYDVYCWAMDSAVNTQGLARPNYQTQAYVNTPVGTTLAHAQTSPSGGKTTYVWVKDLTPPTMIYVSNEALSEDTIQITLQLDEPGTVWCVPTLTTSDSTYMDTTDITSANYKDQITGATAPVTFQAIVPQAYTNVDLEVNRVVRDDDTAATLLSRESLYNIYCFAADDWDFEATGAAQQSINFQTANVGPPNEVPYSDVTAFSTAVGQVVTLDLTPPTIQINSVSTSETTITVNLELSETGTAWCQAVRQGFNVPTILEILDSNFTTEYIHYQPTTVPVDVVIEGYDRPRNWDPTYMTPLQLGTYYDIYCYADDDLCVGCKVTNGVSFNYVSTSANQLAVRTLDLTPPQMRYISAESIAHDQIIITLQVDEGAKVWCAAWATDPVLSATADAGTASTLLQSESPYNVFCFAEDDWSALTTSSADKSPNWNAANVPTPNMTVGNGNEVAFISVDNFMTTVGQILTLDLTPPTINPIVLVSDETNINVTVSLDEAGTVWCQAVRKDFNPPTILEILDTNYYSFYNGASDSTVEITGYDKPINYLPDYERPLVLGTDYDVYCFATDDLCVGCRNPNGVTFSTVVSTKLGIRTKDYTMPELRFVATESIANDKIIITVQVDEGAMIWCAAWSADPAFTDSTDAENQIKSQQTNCEDGRGNQCGTFWVYDLDDIEDADADGVTSRTDYDDIYKWKYNQDVDIIVSGLSEETNYPFIYCFAQDDEVPANKMIFDSTGNFGPSNVYTLQQGIGTVQTLDESPPIFTELTIPDPTALNDRIVITFKLNEAGTAYCRTKRSDSAEPTLHINQILSADFSAEIIDPTLDTGTITLTSLERRNPASVIYEASQYDIYCWARDSAVDSHGFSRPNYMTQSYVETPVGVVTSPAGGLTENVWVVDTTAPSIIVVAREALAESTVQVTLQLNEPGTIWCQVADQDGSSFGTRYCQNSALEWTVTTDPCYAETWIQGVSRGGTDNTQFMKEVGTAYQDFDIDMTQIEKVTSPVGGESMLGNYNVHVWCFAQDDWVQQAPTPSPSPSFVAPTLPNKVDQSHMTAVNLAIGQITTRDQTPPTFTTTPVSAALSETSLQITLTLDEAGTIWCMPVRSTFAEPSINEILQNNEYTSGCTTSCIVTMANLDAKTLYDIWCYAEDDNVYPQIPNGQKFTAAEVQTISTQDTTPPILTIVSAESPISSDIRIKVKMDEPGTVWCNSFQTGTAYQPASPTSASDWFNAVVGGGFLAYVGFPGLAPNSPINTNVEVVVSGLAELTQYDTYCAAQDASTLPSINQNVEATILNTFPALGQITTLDQSPPVYEELGASGIDENTIRVTFKCNEACRAYCRVTRSDSGETSLSINRILKADYYADQLGSGGASSTIDLQRLENDATLTLLDRGTLYDVFCWSRDEAVQHSCWAEGAGATCSTYPRNNYQAQSYVDTVFGGTPPSTITNGAGLPGGKILHVRTPDTTAPVIIFVEAESTEESSITVTLQLDEPGTAYCKAYTTMQSADSTLYTALTTSPIYSNTVTNWNNIYRNFDIKVSGLTMETKYYVYCAAEDDEMVEGASTISPAPTSNNEAIPVLTESSGRFTLDLTPPIISVQAISSATENTATVTLQLDEPGTAWCSAVRDQLTPPSINQIIAADFSNTVTTANTDFTVRVENLMRDTEYDVYCHARDRGTEVEVGITPDAGNPGNDVDHTHVLTTKRDIHTLGDSTAPIVSSVSPAHMQTGVAVKPTLQIVFNEDIKVGGAGTGEVHLFPATPGSPPSGSGQITLYVSDVASGVCNPAKLTIYLTTFTADWSACGASSPLSSSMDWYVTFAAGVFQDTVGNDVAAFGASNTYYFQTA